MIFSPSSTQSWTECPVKWKLQRDGWKPRYLGYPALAAMRGVAFHAGAAALHEGKAVGDAILMGSVSISNDLALMKHLGQRWADGTPGLEPDDSLVRSALVKYASWFTSEWPAQWKIEDVELSMPEHGNTRIDLGVAMPNNISVIDLKFKAKLEAKYVASTLAEYNYDPKMLHHCWAYSSVKGLPVSTYWVLLVIAEPQFRVEMKEFVIQQSWLEQWHTSVEIKWGMMEGYHDRAYLPEGPHFTKFGPCEFLEACAEMGRDYTLMERAYVKGPTHA